MEKGRIDWNAIRAEYIGGGISQRKLAEKYRVSRYSIQKRATAERWTEKRGEAQAVYTEKAIQKSADIASENAAIAGRIKEKLLRKIEAELDAMTDGEGSEWRESVTSYQDMIDQEGETVGKIPRTTTTVRRIRDLTAAWKDLTADMPGADPREDSALNAVREILGGIRSAIK